MAHCSVVFTQALADLAEQDADLLIPSLHDWKN
jgi:hypothetical protein